MVDFTYYNATKIEFGKDKEKEIAKHMSADGIQKVLLCYGSERIKKDGLFDSVIATLQAEGISHIELGGIVSNPLLSKVYEGVEVAKEHNVEAILSVGGGSVLDSAKAIAAGALYEVDVWDFFTGESVIEKALPVYDIITLAATGSEMNGYAVVTNEKTKEKYSIASEHVYPRVSIINPELQMSVSADYLAYSAADIIAHTIEGYFTASVQPVLLSRFVESIIKTVMETTETLLENPNDYDGRAEFAWAATQALNGMTTAGSGGFSFPNHTIEHALSAVCNVPHGAGLSIVMPAWMRWYKDQNPSQFKRFAKEIFGLESAEEGIMAFKSWFDTIGTPTSLEQADIIGDTLENVIDNAAQNAVIFGLSETYTREVIADILEFAK